jgi:hypothetical protein
MLSCLLAAVRILIVAIDRSYLFQGIGFLIGSLLLLAMSKPDTVVSSSESTGKHHHDAASKLSFLCRSVFHLQQDLISIVFEPGSSIRSGVCVILDKIRVSAHLLQLPKKVCCVCIRISVSIGCFKQAVAQQIWIGIGSIGILCLCRSQQSQRHISHAYNRRVLYTLGVCDDGAVHCTGRHRIHTVSGSRV